MKKLSILVLALSFGLPSLAVAYDGSESQYYRYREQQSRDESWRARDGYEQDRANRDADYWGARRYDAERREREQRQNVPSYVPDPRRGNTYSY